MLALRVLPGNVTEYTGWYGFRGDYDSVRDQKTYVIKNPRQTLPCFLIYYY